MGSVAYRSKNKTSTLKDYVSWFEIPAVNFNQAVLFYNAIYDIKMEVFAKGEYNMALFPSNGGISGAVVAGPSSVPSETGPLLYMNGGDDLNVVLSRIPAAGGRIIMNKTLINAESGYFAVFIDSEGNKLALHSQN